MKSDSRTTGPAGPDRKAGGRRRTPLSRDPRHADPAAAAPNPFWRAALPPFPD
jgi:hypothetical protein